jgi:Holliday junction resolvasome RuvABC ATP-dependent DNA helicase subunit
MEFFGQTRIITELNIIIKELLKGENLNLLFRAPSGYGKTVLGLKILSYFPNNFKVYVPQNGRISELDFTKRIHFIDEVHELLEPEYLYPFMDSKRFIFLFASNESGDLKEPLVNRCIPFIFSDYSKDEMLQMIHTLLLKNNLYLNSELEEVIVNNTQNNPRIAEQLCRRLVMVFKNYCIPKTREELENILMQVLQIHDGFTEYHDRYLNYLNRVRVSSLDNISSATRIDKATIKRDIEPYLLYKNLIRISSKGRGIIN